MSYYNSKDYWRKKIIAENRIKSIAPEIKNQSGIYIWYRYVEIAEYIGQARNLIDRSIQHLNQYDHLGNSIRNHGLYSKNNPFGWRLKYYYCDQTDLDRLEREEIAKAQELGFTLLNITNGGQNVGKTDINKRAESKGYRDGLKQGYANCRKEIKTLFEKYLDFAIKGNNNKIKERKYSEFVKWLENENE